MPNPGASSYLRPDLRQRYEEYDYEYALANLIGLELMPIMPVRLQAASLPKLDLAAMAADGDVDSVTGGAAARDDYELAQDSYATVSRQHEEKLFDRERKIWGYAFDLEMTSVERAMYRIMINHEKRVAAEIFNTTKFFNTNVTIEWDNDNSTPIKDVLALIQRVKYRCGRRPNTLAMNDKVFDNLQRNPEVQDRIKYSGRDDPKDVTPEALAALFRLDKVLVGESVKNTAGKDQAASFEDVWDDEYVWAGVVDTAMDPRRPRVGNTIVFVGQEGEDETPNGLLVDQYRWEPEKADVFRVQQDCVEKVLGIEASTGYSIFGELLGNITT